MKTVQLVTGVKVTEVPLLGRDEIPYYGNLKNTRCVYEKEGVEKFLALDAVQDTQHARVTHFKESDKPDIYIAWTGEVEKVIGIPLRVILEEKDKLEKKLDKTLGDHFDIETKHFKLMTEYGDIFLKLKGYENMSFWQRLKWAFKGG